jgi:hypothetical protein
VPKQPRLDQRNPCHPIYANDRAYQSKIIVAKLKRETLGTRKPTIQQAVLMEAAAVLVIELRHYQQSYLKAKKTRASKQFYSTLNSLRVTLAQLPPKGRPGKSIKGGEPSLDLTSIVNGD